ncbi:MAG: DUF3617 domain-containing protein [Alphaproteobacteria bacterium]|nr:DUF3617 domain-containing protein [Alphaproteobacteria bacterium]
MKVSHRVFGIGVALAAATAVALPAIAVGGHGKVGLWDITVTTNMAGMPDMSKLPPEAQAAMRAHGVSANGHTMTVQHCMTQTEIDTIKPPPMHGAQNCKMSNLKNSGPSMSADMTCTGDMNATGHFEISYDSPEHYTGKTTITGTDEGHPINSTTTMEGRWVSADCKGVTH